MPAASPSAPIPVTVIEPVRGWRNLDLRELWRYRELLWVLVARDVKVRYKQTVLGALWAVIQPLTAMALFTLVFGRFAQIPSDGHPYAVWVYTALLPWTFFASSLSAASGSLVGSAQLISKVYFPRLIIPLSSVGSNLIDFAIATGVLLGLMLIYDVDWSLRLLFLPVLVLATALVALGTGTLLGALTVAYRDFRYVVPFLVQIWLYATPVVYPTSLVPERWVWVLYLNPMAGVVEASRAVFLGNAVPWAGLAISLVVALIVFIAGVAYFEKFERRFADII